MIVIEVVDGGMFTTVQDLGRLGYGRYGVPASGAMDRSSCLAANALVGNPAGAAVLEATLIGPSLRFVAPATVAVAGADLGARLDDEALPPWQSATVLPGQTLSFTAPVDGVRAYLAVSGGLDIPAVLGSRSTYARGRLGGLEGRPLKAGDKLAIPGEAAAVQAGTRALPPEHRPAFGHAHTLRVILGPQEDRFTREGIETLLSATFTVSSQADRMGYRLQGPAIQHARGADIVSDGSPLGAVQVAGDGQPIVLMADRGTAGGYTKVATVISTDVWRLAQAGPGDSVRFEKVTLAQAHAALRDHARWLQRIAWTAMAAEPGAPSPLALRRRKAAAAAAAVARMLGENGG